MTLVHVCILLRNETLRNSFEFNTNEDLDMHRKQKTPEDKLNLPRRQKVYGLLPSKFASCSVHLCRFCTLVIDLLYIVYMKIKMQQMLRSDVRFRIHCAISIYFCFRKRFDSKQSMSCQESINLLRTQRKIRISKALSLHQLLAHSYLSIPPLYRCTNLTVECKKTRCEQQKV